METAEIINIPDRTEVDLCAMRNRIKYEFSDHEIEAVFLCLYGDPVAFSFVRLVDGVPKTFTAEERKLVAEILDLHDDLYSEEFRRLPYEPEELWGVVAERGTSRELVEIIHSYIPSYRLFAVGSEREILLTWLGDCQYNLKLLCSAISETLGGAE